MGSPGQKSASPQRITKQNLQGIKNKKEIIAFKPRL